jgi:hypothetical protein
VESVAWVTDDNLGTAIAAHRIDRVEQFGESNDERHLFVRREICAITGDNETVGCREHRIEQEMPTLETGVTFSGTRTGAEHIVPVEAPATYRALVKAEDAHHTSRHSAQRNE